MISKILKFRAEEHRTALACIKPVFPYPSGVVNNRVVTDQDSLLKYISSIPLKYYEWCTFILNRNVQIDNTYVVDDIITHYDSITKWSAGGLPMIYKLRRLDNKDPEGVFWDTATGWRLVTDEEYKYLLKIRMHES